MKRMYRFKQLTVAMRFMILGLCVTLVLASCGEKEAFVESGKIGDITWKLTQNGTLIISGKGEMPDSERPWLDFQSSINAVIIESGVTTIGTSAFSGFSSLTEATIPNSITAIGRGTFGGCSNLAVVNFNAIDCAAMGGMSSMAGSSYVYSVFGGCNNLTTVNIGNEVKTIPTYAFYGLESLTSITIPNSVEFIEERAFYNCSGLTSITIPSSVKYIGNDAFLGCRNLTSIDVDANNNAFGSDNGILFHKYKSEKTILILCPMAKTGVYNIPNSVVGIFDYAFLDCRGLTSLTIGNSVEVIGIGAFLGCSGLTSITIGNSVEHIGESAFAGCSSLTSITIPNSVISMGWNIFRACVSLSEIINQRAIPQAIDEYVFYDNGINKTAGTCRFGRCLQSRRSVERFWKYSSNRIINY